MWIVVIIPASWLPRWLAKQRLLEPTSLSALLLFLTVMVGVSLYATFDLEFSLSKVAGILLGIFVFLGLSQFTNTENRLKCTIGIFLAGGIGLIPAALVGTAWSTKFPVFARLVQLFPTRFKGLPGAEEGFNPNAVGGSLVLFLPLVATLGAYFVRREHRVGRAEKLAFGGIVFLLLLMGGTLLLSQSRGAWLGLCAGIALLLLLKYSWMRWAGIVLAAMSVPVALFFKPWAGWGQISGNGFIDSGELSLAVRQEIWSRGIHGIQDFPFTGMGMNAFRKVVHVLYPLSTIPPEVDTASCHNQLLQTALDLGIPGLIAYTAIWAAAFRLLWCVWRKSQDPFHRAVALGLGCGLLAQFAFGINDAIALGAKVGIFWWIALALTVSLEKLQGQETVAVDGGNRKSPKFWELALMWILFSLLSIFFVEGHPYTALATAIAGGIYLGFQSART
jgi:putative inorganic carbon (HCO3(-)) transporter